MIWWNRKTPFARFVVEGSLWNMCAQRRQWKWVHGRVNDMSHHHHHHHHHHQSYRDQQWLSLSHVKHTSSISSYSNSSNIHCGRIQLNVFHQCFSVSWYINNYLTVYSWSLPRNSTIWSYTGLIPLTQRNWYKVHVSSDKFWCYS